MINTCISALIRCSSKSFQLRRRAQLLCDLRELQVALAALLAARRRRRPLKGLALPRPWAPKSHDVRSRRAPDFLQRALPVLDRSRLALE